MFFIAYRLSLIIESLYVYLFFIKIQSQYKKNPLKTYESKTVKYKTKLKV